jgi:glycerol-3-phosphate O-acyltransferase/dihydroxyacetone phosphate acyltransferase
VCGWILIETFQVPVIRPQDLATKGKGRLVKNPESNSLLNGQDTEFKTQVAKRDIIVLSKTLQFEVLEVVSDTELKLKTELTPEALEHLMHADAYKIIPHIDQSVLYEKVHERLNTGESIVIFPEGGSHDRSEMLPLKGKVF